MEEPDQAVTSNGVITFQSLSDTKAKGKVCGG
jgi:hypothetical protein